MIRNGIIQANEIFGTPFLVDLVPKDNKPSRPGLPMTPTSITIHETDNEHESADARMHTIYIDNTRNYVGWHFTIDDNAIIQEVPIIENAWHAGCGPRCAGNRSSIAIEICVNRGIDFEKAKMNAIKLIHYLRTNADTIGAIYQHNHWNGKNCPRRIRKSGWDRFLTKVRDFEEEQKETKYPVPDWSLDSWIWSVDNNINDGIVQNETEIQTVKMLFEYHKKFIIPIYDKLGIPHD